MPKNMTEIFAEAAQKVIENPPKCGSKKWVTNVTPTLFTNRDNAKRWQHQRKSAASKERWKDLAKQVQESYLEDERRFKERQIAEAEQANTEQYTRCLKKDLENYE